MKQKKQNDIDRIIARHKASQERIIPILQDIQKQFGYLSEEALRHVGNALGISAARVFSVAAFYSGFTFTPSGKNRIEVCHGTACHVRGSSAVTEHIGEALGIRPGQTTSDGLFSLHTVRCLGCCALAPVVKINNRIHAGMFRKKALSILERYR